MLFVLDKPTVWTKTVLIKIGNGRKPNVRKQDWTKTELDEKLWTKTRWTKRGWTKTECTSLNICKKKTTYKIWGNAIHTEMYHGYKKISI